MSLEYAIVFGHFHSATQEAALSKHFFKKLERIWSFFQEQLSTAHRTWCFLGTVWETLDQRICAFFRTPENPVHHLSVCSYVTKFPLSGTCSPLSWAVHFSSFLHCGLPYSRTHHSFVHSSSLPLSFLPPLAIPPNYFPPFPSWNYNLFSAKQSEIFRKLAWVLLA